MTFCRANTTDSRKALITRYPSPSSTKKFRKRFAHVESHAKRPGASLAEMEALWQEAKSHDD